MVFSPDVSLFAFKDDIDAGRLAFAAPDTIRIYNELPGTSTQTPLVDWGGEKILRACRTIATTMEGEDGTRRHVHITDANMDSLFIPYSRSPDEPLGLCALNVVLAAIDTIAENKRNVDGCSGTTRSLKTFAIAVKTMDAARRHKAQGRGDAAQESVRTSLEFGLGTGSFSAMLLLLGITNVYAVELATNHIQIQAAVAALRDLAGRLGVRLDLTVVPGTVGLNVYGQVFSPPALENVIRDCGAEVVIGFQASFSAVAKVCGAMNQLDATT